MSATIGAIAAARRPKWQYPPPPPTPRILHLPRRPRRRAHPKVKKPSPEVQPPPPSDRALGNLETLFGQERAFAKPSVPIVVLEEKRRERVKERESSEVAANGGEKTALEEEKWRFQAEMLRAECNLLRMEKEIAMNKLERTRVKTQRALRSVIHSLVSERQKICEGNSSKAELEGEIQQLAEKLEKLRRNLEGKNKNSGARKKCHNLDKHESVHRGETNIFRGSSDEVCLKKIQEMAEVSLSIKTMSRVNETLLSSDDSNVEILRRKMEGLSNGMLLERMREECGSMLSTANSSVASSASTSKRIEFVDMSSSSIQQSEKPKNETAKSEENVCSGRCKAVVRRILEQVRAETEQWSQMQEMLGQVREEMEELQASRDFWEDRALDYDYKLQALHSDVKEWEQKAISSQNKANQLEAKMYFLSKELERARSEEKVEERRTKASPPRMAVDGQHEMEKRVLICRLKENRINNINNCNHRVNPNALTQSNNKFEAVSSDGRRRKPKTQSQTGVVVASERSPLRDIGNSCVSFKQHSKAILPLMPSRTSKNL